MTRPLYDYSRWPNFSKEELVCTHTGLENPNTVEFTELMNFVQHIRTLLNCPLVVTSCYRHETHPYEINKVKPGQHNLAAIDLQVPVDRCHEFVAMAFTLGFTGIGWKLHGAHKNRFIHLDRRLSPPRLWTYP